MNANELAKMLFHYWNKTEGVEISQTLLNDAADMLRQQQVELVECEECITQMASRIGTSFDEIEEWKRKCKDMHNLATQAMSRVHELEKAQEK